MLQNHICYIINLNRFQQDYPDWQITRSLESIFEELASSQQASLC
ncbi:MAG: hypothetical protein AB4426_08005 [Xenococcaceae cyanobacterium]